MLANLSSLQFINVVHAADAAEMVDPASSSRAAPRSAAVKAGLGITAAASSGNGSRSSPPKSTLLFSDIGGDGDTVISRLLEKLDRETVVTPDLRKAKHTNMGENTRLMVVACGF